MPAGDPVAFTSSGRPKRGFGVTKASMSRQYRPSRLTFSCDAHSACISSVNSSAMA
jgi:hypothetical protein